MGIQTLVVNQNYETNSNEIRINQGSIKTLVFSVAKGNLAGAVAGYNGIFTLARTLDSKPSVTINSFNGLTIDPVNSKITVVISDKITSLLRFAGKTAKWVYQLEIVDPSGNITRIADGCAIMTKEIPGTILPENPVIYSNLDGGSVTTIYAFDATLDGGSASSTYTDFFDGGNA